MFRIFALTAVIGMASLSAGTANAHPPDLYGSTYASGYSSTYTPSYSTRNASYYNGYNAGYGSPYVSPTYGTSYGTTYNAPSYSAPSYTTPTYGHSTYAAPSYGYRHRSGRRHHRGVPGYARNLDANYPVTAYSHRSFGPYGDIPSTEGFNVGYAGGPTYGNDSNAVINGVRMNASPR